MPRGNMPVQKVPYFHYRLVHLESEIKTAERNAEEELDATRVKERFLKDSSDLGSPWEPLGARVYKDIEAYHGMTLQQLTVSCNR
jgi:hypothetical protein